jgi:hypothetical protein
MVRDREDPQLVINYGVNDLDRKVLHDETTLAVLPLGSKAWMLQQ